MRKHSAKRLDTKESFKRKKKKKLKFRNFLIILFAIIVFIIILRKKFSLDFLSNTDANKENPYSVSLSSLLTTNEVSEFEQKTFGNTDLKLSNLFLKYENNITVIEFEVLNESLKEQPVFNFNFALLDTNNIEIINYDLSSEESILPNSKKKFVLIASRDVSTASDYNISINE